MHARLVVLASVLSFAALGCATAPAVPSDSKPATLSIQNLVCSDCGKELEAKALKVPGVRAAHFDDKKVELQLELAPTADAEAVVKAITAEPVDGKSITASIGAGHGAYAPFTTPEPGWDVKQLSQKGEDVPDLQAALAPGKANIVDFYADWCGPCHELDEHIHALLAKDPHLAYRRVDVMDWDSPAAKHYLVDAKELPYVIVFDAHGKEVTRLSGLHPDELDAAVQKGER